MSAVGFAVGIAAGLLYFGGLWWSTRLFTQGGSKWTMILLMAGRFLLLSGLLTLASLQGAMPLLTTTLGILVARFAVVRKARPV